MAIPNNKQLKKRLKECDKAIKVLEGEIINDLNDKGYEYSNIKAYTDKIELLILKKQKILYIMAINSY